jgi:hypothetical protein
MIVVETSVDLEQHAAELPISFLLWLGSQVQALQGSL